METPFQLREFLPDSRIEVWQLDLRRIPEPSLPCDRLLSQEEMRRAERFVMARDGARYRLCHALLRLGLAWFLAKPPQSVDLVTNANGKPRVKTQNREGADLHFNLTHCREMALIAFSRTGEVGIDIESVGRDLEPMEIASAYFSPEETATIAAMREGTEQGKRFLRLWTRKEAVLKAAGLGIFYGLDRVDVRLEGSETVVLPADVDRAESVWAVRDLEMPEGFLAALAAEPGVWQTHRIQVTAVTVEGVLGQVRQRFPDML